MNIVLTRPWPWMSHQKQKSGASSVAAESWCGMRRFSVAVIVIGVMSKAAALNVQDGFSLNALISRQLQLGQLVGAFACA